VNVSARPITAVMSNAGTAYITLFLKIIMIIPPTYTVGLQHVRLGDIFAMTIVIDEFDVFIGSNLPIEISYKMFLHADTLYIA
jgi:hypothetical protein